LRPLLHLDVLTVDGRTLGEVLEGPYEFPAWQEVIRPARAPLRRDGSLIVLRGNLAPEGAVLKRSAASPELLTKTGRGAVGGPLAVVRSGDRIAVDAGRRALELLVEPGELAARRARWRPPRPKPARGYPWLYQRHVQQAHLGADFDFLRHESLREGPAEK